MILPQRMPLPGGGHENPLQMGMPVKADAEHVPRFTFIPVGRRPKINDTWRDKLVFLKRYLDPDVCIPVHRTGGGRQREIACGLALAVGSYTLINGGQIIEHTVWRGDVLLQIAQDTEGLFTGRPDRSVYRPSSAAGMISSLSNRF